MTPEKEYNPQEPVAITLTMEQWQIMLAWLQYGTDYHRCKMHEWLANCSDKRAGSAKAREHEIAAAEAEQLYKLIEGVLIPAPPPETE